MYTNVYIYIICISIHRYVFVNPTVYISIYLNICRFIEIYMCVYSAHERETEGGRELELKCGQLLRRTGG